MTPSDPTKRDDAKFLYERWKYEDETLAQRTDWFLIFHGILLEAFFAGLKPTRQLPVALFGVLTAFLWFWIGIRHWWDHQHLNAVIKDKKLDSLGKILRGISVAREKQCCWMKYARGTPCFAIIIPAAATIVWTCCLGLVADSAPLVLKAVSLSRLGWTLVLLVVIVALAVGAALFFGTRPKFGPELIKDVLAEAWGEAEDQSGTLHDRSET